MADDLSNPYQSPQAAHEGVVPSSLKWRVWFITGYSCLPLLLISVGLIRLDLQRQNVPSDPVLSRAFAFGLYVVLPITAAAAAMQCLAAFSRSRDAAHIAAAIFLFFAALVGLMLAITIHEGEPDPVLIAVAVVILLLNLFAARTMGRLAATRPRAD